MPYFVDYLPVTSGNDLTLYVDGKDYCTDLFLALNAATKFVTLTGLHFMQDFDLVRGKGVVPGKSGLARTLAITAERGVEIFLLVNQFWEHETEIWDHDVKDPIKQLIATQGELWGYLPETYRLFMTLAPYKNVHCRTQRHPNTHTFGTHHQKAIVIDDKVAFFGGADLTFLDGDRWDTGKHTREFRASDRTQCFWHDVHMQAKGPAVQFVRDNFVQRWTGAPLRTLRSGGKNILSDIDPSPPRLPVFPKPKPYRYPTGSETPDQPLVQIVRSMPAPDPIGSSAAAQIATTATATATAWNRVMPRWNKSGSPWERSCKDAYLIGIRAASRYIYLENQWISDEDIWSELASAAKRNKDNADFRIVLMIPHEPLFAAGMGSNQELFIGSELEGVINASRDEGTFGMYSLLKYEFASGNGQLVGSNQIYIHSKIMIIDDEWSLVGSANAGGISLEGVRSGRDRPDSELSAIILDREFASSFRKRLWDEHLELAVDKTYASRDADHFRRVAGKRLSQRVHFFPGYDNIKHGRPTIWSSDWLQRTGPPKVDVTTYKKLSRIESALPGSTFWPTLVPAVFKAVMYPPPPTGYRFWYRWKVQLNYDLVTGSRSVDSIDFKMRSLRYDRDEVYEYSDQEAVYIGADTARAINSEITTDIAHGLIVCRVQVVPMHEGPDPNNVAHDSFVLELPVMFLEEELAKSDLEDFRKAHGLPADWMP